MPFLMSKEEKLATLEAKEAIRQQLESGQINESQATELYSQVRDLIQDPSLLTNATPEVQAVVTGATQAVETQKTKDRNKKIAWIVLGSIAVIGGGYAIYHFLIKK